MGSGEVSLIVGAGEGSGLNSKEGKEEGAGLKDGKEEGEGVASLSLFLSLSLSLFLSLSLSSCTLRLATGIPRTLEEGNDSLFVSAKTSSSDSKSEAITNGSEHERSTKQRYEKATLRGRRILVILEDPLPLLESL